MRSRRAASLPRVPVEWRSKENDMTYAILTIERALNEIELKSLKASPGARRKLAFGIVSAAYAVVVAAGLLGAHAGASI
jgi:hypothetical protein